ncbi:MAG: hypothetical protein Q8N60_00305 [Candidatus Diapherotrites archaeon]|nr:hypothetical protein [Candidatus Diapherotrites archaeon]
MAARKPITRSAKDRRQNPAGVQLGRYYAKDARGNVISGMNRRKATLDRRSSKRNMLE